MIGTVHTIGYTWALGKIREPYYHPFERRHPVLAALGHGQYAIVGGGFRVTSRGIMG